MDQVLNLRNWLTELFPDTQSFRNHSQLACQDLLTLNPDHLYDNEYGKNLLRFYCFEAAIDFFEIICARFPPSLLPYIFLDAKNIRSKTHLFQLLDQPGLEFIQVGLKNSSFNPIHAMGWETHSFINGYLGKELLLYKKPNLASSIGIIVPLKKIFDPDKLKKIDHFIEGIESKEPVRLISERNIAVDWQGLDTLIVFEVEQSSKRKLEGFIAAGGTVCYVERPIGLSEEKQYLNMKKKEGL